MCRPAGGEDEFIFCGRLDNLCMSYCSLRVCLVWSVDGRMWGCGSAGEGQRAPNLLRMSSCGLEMGFWHALRSLLRTWDLLGWLILVLHILHRCRR